MKFIEKVLEVSVLLLMTVMFGGYALLVYPIERLRVKLNKEAKHKQLKYSPQRLG